MQALNSGGDGDAGVRGGINVGDLIHHYGAQFVAKAPEIALEYYILAAEAMGNGKETKAQLLKELLTESNAFGFLLGAGGNTGGQSPVQVLNLHLGLDSWADSYFMSIY